MKVGVKAGEWKNGREGKWWRRNELLMSVNIGPGAEEPSQV